MMKKNNKNVVRLSESQLRKMVAESVREALSELDWKTANWASNERARRNADVRQNIWNSPYAEKYDKMGGGNLYNGIEKGENAAFNSAIASQKSFNNQHGLNGTNNRVHLTYQSPHYKYGTGKAGVFAQASNNDQTVSVHTPTDRTSQDSQFRLDVLDSYSDRINYGTNYRGADKNTVMQNLSKANPDIAKRFNDAYNEVENYNNGNYYYDNGWKLKESRLRKIVSESINKVLKEERSMHNIENWWRHNGSYDREQASGIPYNGGDDYLSTTDNWWESLTDEEKEQVFNDFFEEV